MDLYHKIRRNIFYAVLLIIFNVVVLCIWSNTVLADTKKTEEDPVWTIHFHPGIRWGTDDRTLYVLDFLIPLYQGEKSILFANTKFTPNDQDGWELNLGIGYRHLLFDDSVILGINAFYDKQLADGMNVMRLFPRTFTKKD